MAANDDVRNAFEEAAEALKKQREQAAASAPKPPSVTEMIDWMHGLLDIEDQ